MEPEPDPIWEAAHAIHDASERAPKLRSMPSPAAMLDTAIVGLKEVNATYLPALIQVLETLKTFTPG
jgi:hypothetical protein